VIGLLNPDIITVFLFNFYEKYNYKITELMIITFGIPNLMCFILILKLTSKKLIVLSNLKTNTFREFKILIKKGKLFLILQIGIMIGWGLDATIIASKLGAVDVAVYNIIQKIFYIVSQPLCMINAPLWGAYANAKNIRDNQFINQTLKKSLFSTFYLSVIIGFLLFINSQSIIKLYTKETIVIHEILILLYYIWTIIESLGNAFAMFLNGCNLIKEQALTIFIFAILSLPIKIYAITTWGLEGMITSQIFVYIVCSLVFYGFIFKYIFKNK
jgi:O-antigen/teichoic acid export membrane protein